MVYFVKRFPILTTKLEGKLDVLYDQWVEYQLLSNVHITESRVDKVWNEIGSIKRQDGQPKFDLLFEVAKHILLLPHSNAEEERIFSTVKKTCPEIQYKKRLCKYTAMHGI